MSRFVLSIPKVKSGVRDGAEVGSVWLRCSSDVRDHFASLREWAREAFVAFYLNTKNELLEASLISVGTIDSAAVYPREVVRTALEAGAASVVFAHNHPSGDPDPSLCDRELTRSLVLACGLMQIKVLDHVVLGSGSRSYSFADQGLISEYDQMLHVTECYRGIADPQAWVTP
jgi:DNA repair protein RadC